MRTLAIRCGRLGDAILTFPALSALSVLYPESEIVVLTEERTASLFPLHPNVAEVVALPGLFYKKPELREWAAIVKTVCSLKRRGFDYVFDFQDGSWLTALIARFVSQRKTAGFKNFKKGWMYHAGPYGKAMPGADRIESMALSYFRVAVSFSSGVDENLFNQVCNIRFCLGHRKHSPADRYIFFHLGANESHKTWSRERFLSLAEIVRKNRPDLRIVFSVNSEDVGNLNSFFNEQGMMHCQAWTTNSIAELALKIRDCEVFVSTDTGPSHLASALAVRRIILCQPFVNRAIWYGEYQGENCVYISSKREKCSACVNFSGCELASCTDNIRPEEVAEKIFYLLRNNEL